MPSLQHRSHSIRHRLTSSLIRFRRAAECRLLANGSSALRGILDDLADGILHTFLLVTREPSGRLALVLPVEAQVLHLVIPPKW